MNQADITDAFNDRFRDRYGKEFDESKVERDDDGQFAESGGGGATMESLIADRRKITEALSRVDRGAFPGSAAYREETRLIVELSAFDEEHPEVLREIRKPKSDVNPWNL